MVSAAVSFVMSSILWCTTGETKSGLASRKDGPLGHLGHKSRETARTVARHREISLAPFATFWTGPDTRHRPTPSGTSSRRFGLVDTWIDQPEAEEVDLPE
jgi:hypothetical protein